MKQLNFRIFGRVLVALVLAITLITPLLAQRRGGGSFGGGRSFGGGSSFGGGRSSSSFGSGRSSSSFGSGRSSSSFGSSSGSTRSSSSSFGRSGSFGSSGRVTSTSVNPSSRYSGMSPSRTTNVYYGGGYYPAYHYGGFADYSFGWARPAWYMYTPFYPSFYYGPPVMYGGAMYPGEFSFFRLILGLIIFFFVIWLLVKIFGGGGKRVRYTSYN